MLVLLNALDIMCNANLYVIRLPEINYLIIRMLEDRICVCGDDAQWH